MAACAPTRPDSGSASAASSRRSAVRHGYVLERDDRVYVRLGRMLRLVEVEVEDRAEGEALLAGDAARCCSLRRAVPDDQRHVARVARAGGALCPRSHARCAAAPGSAMAWRIAPVFVGCAAPSLTILVLPLLLQSAAAHLRRRRRAAHSTAPPARALRAVFGHRRCGDRRPRHHDPAHDGEEIIDASPGRTRPRSRCRPRTARSRAASSSSASRRKSRRIARAPTPMRRSSRAPAARPRRGCATWWAPPTSTRRIERPPCRPTSSGASSRTRLLRRRRAREPPSRCAKGSTTTDACDCERSPTRARRRACAWRSRPSRRGMRMRRGCAGRSSRWRISRRRGGRGS